MPFYWIFFLFIGNCKSNIFGSFMDTMGVAFEDSFQMLKSTVSESCNQYDIPGNLAGLKHDLEERVYGQHLVVETVVNAIQGHWGPHKSHKALTLSFHGWPGGGKNYVSRFIVDNLFKYGSKSRFVHQFIGRLDFPSKDSISQYQVELKRWIIGNVSSCGRQLFIFDEVDKMPATLLDVLKPFIDYRESVDGVDHREAIFIFLSNTGGTLINEHYADIWKRDGRKREDLKLFEFEKLVTMGAFNEEGGFQFSDNIKSNLIDHYVPFLPMEYGHVKKCVLDQFHLRNILNPSDEHIREAMEFVEWGGPSGDQLFSTTGCKRISQKVSVIIAKYKL